MDIKGLILSLFLFLSLSCKNSQDFYYGLEHRGDRRISVQHISVDSIFFDASMTSLSGQWLISPAGNKLFFADRYAVGVYSYYLDGKYDTSFITQGRGPAEMSTPSLSACFDENGNFISLDHNSGVNIFSHDFSTRLFYEPLSWFVAIDSSFNNRSWQNLYNSPNPEIPQMYEYNSYVGRISYSSGKLFMPIITEHVSYNGYEKGSHASDFWKNAYTFICYDPLRISSSFKMLGHYPSVYQKNNLPVFSRYDFCVSENKVYVSFNADPYIYVMDVEGNPLYSLGFPDTKIKGDYPSTSTFEEFEERAKKQRKKYGYYDKLYVDHDYVLRTCHISDGECKLQIYKNNDLIGDVMLPYNCQILGRGADGYYYAFKRADYENEQFVIIKFTINFNEI